MIFNFFVTGCSSNFIHSQLLSKRAILRIPSMRLTLILLSPPNLPFPHISFPLKFVQEKEALEEVPLIYRHFAHNQP